MSLLSQLQLLQIEPLQQRATIIQKPPEAFAVEGVGNRPSRRYAIVYRIVIVFCVISWATSKG